MSALRFKVWRSFPVKWQPAEVKLGDTFNVIHVDENAWEAVGGAFYRINSSKTSGPDFSGARLNWLQDNGYIELLSDAD